MYYGMGQGGRDLTLAFALHEVEEGREPGYHGGRPQGPPPTAVRPTRSMTESGNAGRCGQKVNCPKGARETALGHRPLRPWSQPGV